MGLLSIALVALIAVVLLVVDAGDSRPEPRAVPSEQQIDADQVTPSAPNDTPVADPSGPYQPQ